MNEMSEMGQEIPNYSDELLREKMHLKRAALKS
jgi:hypothetical protein